MSKEVQPESPQQSLARLNKRWVKAEEDALIRLIKHGRSVSELTSLFQRTEYALRYKVDRLTRIGELTRKNINWYDSENINKLIALRYQNISNLGIAKLFETTDDAIRQAVATLRKRGYQIPKRKPGPKKR